MSESINPLEMPPIERPDWPKHGPGVCPILVGVAFDDTGVNALQHALRIAASQSKAEVHVAHVITDTAGSARTAVVDRHLKELEDAPAKLQAFVAQHGGEAASAARQHVRIGDAADTLLQLALDYDAEMIVVGTHGRKGFDRLLHGSVAQKLVASGRCPVLIAIPRDFTEMTKTAIPDPMCPDCEAARAKSNGEQQWCEYHARPHIHPHAVAGGHGDGVGGHDPGVVPSGS